MTFAYFVTFALIGSQLLTSHAKESRRLPELKIDAQASENQWTKAVDQWLKTLYQQGRFNGGVLIMRDKETVLQKAYGVANPDTRTTLTTRTPFRLASVSKHFTAAAILVLVEKGELNLDDSVKRFFKTFPYPGVTIRHLLNHTSGIPDAYLDLAQKHRKELGNILEVQNVVQLLSKYPPKKNALPGQNFSYSNTNYVLLAAIIEKVADCAFESFLQKEIFGQLGMSDSRVWNLKSKIPFPNRALDFKGSSKRAKILKPDWIDGVAGDGAVFVSLHDFQTWNRFWRRPTLVSRKLINESFRPAVLTNSKKSHYGFGWELQKEGPHHSGAWMGARTFAGWLQKERLFIVLLDNSSNEEFDEIRRTLTLKLAKAVLAKN